MARGLGMHAAANSITALVVSLDLMQRLLEGETLSTARREAIASCLRELSTSVEQLRTMVIEARLGEGGGE